MAQEQPHLPAGARYADWLAILDAYQVQFLMLDIERDRGLYRAVRTHPNWKLECRDEKSVLLRYVGPAGHGSDPA